MNTHTRTRAPLRSMQDFCLALLCIFAAPVAFGQEPFDHFSTGFPLDGAHSAVTCDRCHTAGNFQGTNRACVGCHSAIGSVQATIRPVNHINSSEICGDCHTTAAWSPLAYMDHSAVAGSCDACHNGIVATGKTPTHIPSTNQCDDCHNSTAWIPAVFDHAGIAGNCFGCHNGIDATGKGPTHVQTTNVCEDCHSSTFWEPAVSVDHTQVLGSCSSCHNGVLAEGKSVGHITSGDNCDDCHTTTAWTPANFDHVSITGNCFSCHNGVDATGKHGAHIASGDNCEDCHTTVAWLPASFDHATIVGNCSNCHNGIDATGKNPGHFITQQECNVCHETVVWSPSIYMHLGLTYEPLDHRGNFACTECHQNNSEPVTWLNAAFQPDCAGCHAGDFRSGPHKKYENPDVTYTVSELRDCTGACHIYTDATMTTIKENRPGPEHRISSGEF